jgi:hypothetical protein
VTNIRIAVAGDIVATGVLDDNESANDFAALLPLDLLLKDYASTERLQTCRAVCR